MSQKPAEADWPRGWYFACGRPTKESAFEYLYDEISKGRPAIAQVNGTPQHFVTVVGFENVTSKDTLSASNFLIIDPAGSQFEIVNMAKAGYDILYYENPIDPNDPNHYLVVCPEGRVPIVNFKSTIPLNRGYFSHCENKGEKYPAFVEVFILEECNPHPIPCSDRVAKRYGYRSEAITEKAFKEGDTVKATGIYKNTEDHYWYEILLDDGRTAYIFADHTVMLTPLSPWVDGGWFYNSIDGATSLNGIVRTTGVLDYVQAVVYQGNQPYGTVVIQSEKVYVGKSSYTLKGSTVDNTLYFEKLGRGNYTLSIEVACSSYYSEFGMLDTTGICTYSAYYNFSVGPIGSGGNSSSQDVVDVGSDFNAYIINTNHWMHLTNDDGNVTLCSETGAYNQIWHFERLGDGSYKITSLYDGTCLDVEGAGTIEGTNVGTYTDNGTAAQRWYINGYSSAYTFKAQCATTVMDVKDNSNQEGANIQMWTSNGTSAQLFQIWKVDVHTHNYYSYTVASTCNDEGYTAHFCDSCGHSYYTDYVDSLGCDYYISEIVDPTGAQKGYTHYQCRRCGGGFYVYTDILGDINRNGEIEKYDYIAVKRAVMGTYDLSGSQKSCADINGNGEVEKYDYILIKRHVMGTFTITK